MLRQRLGGQRGLGYQGQRALGAGDQPGQIELLPVDRSPDAVAATVDRATAAPRFDQVGIAGEHASKAVYQIAFPTWFGAGNE